MRRQDVSLDLYRIKPQDLLLIEGVSYCVKSVIEYKKEHGFCKEFKMETDAGLQFWLAVDRDSRRSKCKLLSRIWRLLRRNIQNVILNSHCNFCPGRIPS